VHPSKWSKDGVHEWTALLALIVEQYHKFRKQ
jgi:hypothetical protein